MTTKQTKIQVAIGNDDLQTIQDLLQDGVNPYKPVFGRRRPMYWAMFYNKRSTIELFLASDYPTNFHNRDSTGRTVLEWSDWLAARGRATNFRNWVSKFQKDLEIKRFEQNIREGFARSKMFVPQDIINYEIIESIPMDPPCQNCRIYHEKED